MQQCFGWEEDHSLQNFAGWMISMAVDERWLFKACHVRLEVLGLQEDPRLVVIRPRARKVRLWKGCKTYVQKSLEELQTGPKPATLRHTLDIMVLGRVAR